VLREVAGKDATKQFKKYHDSRILDRISIKKLIVGALDTSANTPTEQKLSFFSKLKTLVSGKLRLDAVSAGQLKVVEHDVAVSKQHAGAVVGDVEREDIVAQRPIQTSEVVVIASARPPVSTMTSDEEVKEGSVEKK
jgi:hypothetical protein